MIKLWVDDIRPAPEGWHWAKTVTEAIRVLATQKVSEVSFDHDISHDVQINGVHRPYPCGETFEPVAFYLLCMAMVWDRDGGSTLDADYLPSRVNIHSANVGQAENMREMLCGFYPVTVTLGKPCNRFEGK